MHSDSRNRLTTQRATNLVWLYSNLRLLQRTQDLQQGGRALPWMAVADEEQEEEEGMQQEGSSSGGEDLGDEDAGDEDA